MTLHLIKTGKASGGLEGLPIEILLMILEQASAHDNFHVLLTNRTLGSVVLTHADYLGRRLAQRPRRRLCQAIANINFASNNVGLIPALRRWLDSVDIPHVGSYLSTPIWAGEFAISYSPRYWVLVAVVVRTLFNVHGMKALQKQLCADSSDETRLGYVDVYPIPFSGDISKLDHWETSVRALVTMAAGMTPSQYDYFLQQVLEKNPFAGKPGSISVPASSSEWLSQHGDLHQMLMEDGWNFNLPRPPCRLRWYSKRGPNSHYRRFAGKKGKRFGLRSTYLRALFVAAVIEDLGICSTIADHLGGAKVHVRTNW